MKKREKKKTETGEISRIEKIEKAKLEFHLKNLNGPMHITPLDVAKLTGYEDEYREALFEEELKKNYEEIMKPVIEPLPGNSDNDEDE